MIDYIASVIDEAIKPPYNMLAKGLIMSMVYFAIMITLILSFVIMRRHILNAREKRDQMRRVNINNLIIDFLYAPDCEISSELELSLVKSAHTKQIIIDTLVELRDALTGPMHDKLKDLYTQAGLHEISMKKLKSPFWHRRAKGIKELSSMDIEDAHDAIKMHVNDPNIHVSLEAKIALIRMNEEDPLAFLAFTKNRLSHWEQVSIYQNLKNSYKHLPNFTAWLYTENDSITEFCLEMILDFGQKMAQEDLVILMEHPNDQVREKAYRALSVFNPLLASQILPANFDRETPALQRVIVQMLATSSDKCAHFLMTILKRTEYAHLQFETAKSLAATGVGKESLETYAEIVRDSKLNLIVAHLNDTHIYDRI